VKVSWNAVKSRANRKKHGVSFEEAQGAIFRRVVRAHDLRVRAQVDDAIAKDNACSTNEALTMEGLTSENISFTNMP
jgi:uncharacterized DUF497 family protein